MALTLWNKRLTSSLIGLYIAVAITVAFPVQIITAREPPISSCPLGNSIKGASAQDDGLTPTLRQYQGIDKFLGDVDRESSLDKFHVHGWRWHTLSLSQDARRLSQLAQRTMPDDDTSVQSLQQAVDYVVGFNMRGLHRIEADLFFPWMREKLTAISEPVQASEEFASVMDQLESDRGKVAGLGESITRSISVACDTSKADTVRSQAIQKVYKESISLEGYTQTMIEVEDTLLVPAIAQIVSESEQKSFNSRVLRNLGLLDSRLHLVAMHEAVWEKSDDKEKELFELSIPSIARMMIPRWKRKLYEPVSSIFE